MINNISNVDTRLQQTSVVRTAQSQFSVSTPPVIGFKTPFLKEKATIRVKKFKRSDNIVIVGDIDDDYVDIVEEDINNSGSYQSGSDSGGEIINFFNPINRKHKVKYLKHCYVIDYIQSPRQHNGLGTEALKILAEKAMFDSRTEGRIVTYSSPVWKESSPALFFYKLGFRFMERAGNEYMEECLAKKIPDIPPQIGMMYLPKSNLHKLLRYGDLF